MNEVPNETEDPRLSMQNIFNSYLCYSIMQESAKVRFSLFTCVSRNFHLI